MAEVSITPDQFERVVTSHEVQGITRPSLSYWQDAWIRLKANRRALFSLYLIIGLFIFTVAGPSIWRVDPSVQDLDQISQPPGVDRRATIVEPYEPWDESTVLPLSTGLRLSEAATTQSVRLLWEPMQAVGGYRVYRNLFPIGQERAFGLPLAERSETQSTTFEDRLALKPRTYFYTVVGLDQQGQLTNDYQTLQVEVERVITLDEAIAKELVPQGSDLQLGDSVELQLHPFGTDYLGRDMLARLMQGARVSLFIGIFAPFLYILFGVVYGATAGFFGKMVDQLLMRFSDFVVALPFLLFMILIRVDSGVQAGESGIAPLVIAMVLLSWPATARLVRGQILQIREEGYISASRLLGAKTNYLVLRHMIPNTMGVILVTLTFAVPSAIFTEAFLSFIGMGVAPPTPSWGSMCNEGIKTMLTYPHELIFPSLFISITVLAFNMLGDGLRDALDARMRSAE